MATGPDRALPAGDGVHARSAEDAFVALQAGPDGLDATRVAVRREAFGPNLLPERRPSPWAFVAHQLRSVFVWILAAALALSVAVPVLEAERTLGPGDFVDAFVIAGILVLNTLLGAVQEARAERSIAELRSLSSPRTLVRREGRATKVPSQELVPGDVVLLEAGDRVSADLRLVQARSLQVDESALTGESLPVDKHTDAVQADAVVAEQGCMVFAGTLVTGGSGEGLVAHTGARTQVGRLAGLLAASSPPSTPLERQLQRLARVLAIGAGLAVLLVLGVGALRGMPLGELLLVAVSLGVSMVPEGLPAVVTVCFAVGARRMARAGALVRRLDALETLGSVTVLCSDKTGTLTENRMAVVETWGDDLELLAVIGASCNHAPDATHGDPTEVALVRHALDRGVQRLPIDAEPVPFSSERKLMTTVHGGRSFTKGAPSG